MPTCQQIHHNHHSYQYMCVILISTCVISTCVLNNLPNNDGNANSAENVERVFGYDEVFDPPASRDYECPICIMVLRNPVQTPCGHRFCAACINRQIA